MLDVVSRPSEAKSESFRRIVVISGSPTEPSKTEQLASMVASRLSCDGFDVDHVRLRDLPPDDLVGMRLEAGPVATAVAAVALADGIVIATPTFKASFSGLTKLFLDLLPQFGLAGKAVLPLATGGSLAHVLALDYALRPVVQSMGARCVVPSFFVTSESFLCEQGELRLAAKFDVGLTEVLHAFRDALAAPIRLAA